jgi:hypothetical protein
LKEECVSFNPMTAKVREIKGRFFRRDADQGLWL